MKWLQRLSPLTPTDREEAGLLVWSCFGSRVTHACRTVVHVQCLKSAWLERWRCWLTQNCMCICVATHTLDVSSAMLGWVIPSKTQWYKIISVAHFPSSHSTSPEHILTGTALALIDHSCPTLSFFTNKIISDKQRFIPSLSSWHYPTASETEVSIPLDFQTSLHLFSL